MRSLKTNLLAVAIAGLIVGCAGTDKKVEVPAAPAETNADMSALSGEGFLASCDNPVVEEKGPYGETLYVVGTFSDSLWKHKKTRAMSYRGDNVYQLIYQEKVGKFRMQFASSDWSPQFTADGLNIELAKDNVLKYGGLGKDAKVELPVAGKYVWSIQFDAQGTPVKTMVSMCK